MSRTRSGDAPAVRIEADNEWAWCGERRLVLAPRAFALLRHLVEHPQRLITKDDLLAAVWRDAIVSDAALASCVRDLRKALGDSSRGPRYIETVHRRGLRFIGPVAAPTRALSVESATTPRPSAEMPRPSSTPAWSPAPATLVGRDAELARLHERWERALTRQRQLVFVTGEPGIGKTALVEAFLAQIGEGEGLRIGRGQCVEQYGAGEAYLPVLEALGRLGREVGGKQLVHVLKQQAPTWLAQLPSLLTDRDLEAVQRRTEGATRERMLRELVEALDALTLEAPLVLLLEDLHWSDSSTIDLLAMLARRREASRLLVLGTYRPADVAGTAHPLPRLKQELQVHGQCEAVPLEFLSVTAVGQYLSRRFSGHRFPSELARVLHRNTDGNPLFLMTTIDYLTGQGQLRRVDGEWELAGPMDAIALGTPRTLRQMVEEQVERLTADEQAMLTVAGVAGPEFSAAIAVAGGIDPQDGEQRCEALARRGQFLRATGIAEWPDGTIAGRYAFIHVLYQQVLYARVPIGDRVGLHLRIGECLERGHGRRAGELAGELAMHFEHGRDFERAARYLRAAGGRAVRRGALEESIALYDRALAHVSRLPRSPENTGRAIDIRLELHAPLFQLGQASRLVELHREAEQLARELDDQPRLGRVLYRMGSYAWMDARYRDGIEYSRRALDIATALGDRELLVTTGHVLGVNFEALGDYPAAIEQLVRIVDGPDTEIARQRRAVTSFTYVSACAWLAVCLTQIGELERADAYGERGVKEAEAAEHALGEALSCTFRAAPLLSRGEFARALPWCERAAQVSADKGLLGYLPVTYSALGFALVSLGRGEGLEYLERGATLQAKSAIRTRLPEFHTRWADGLLMAGRVEEARQTVVTALAIAAASGERGHEADALWVAARVAAAGHPAAFDEARTLFERASAIAGELGMRPLMARCHLSLGALSRRIGNDRQAREHLTASAALFGEMGMRFWLEQAVVAMAALP